MTGPDGTGEDRPFSTVRRRGVLFCILGRSGSGKDTVFRSLIEDASLGLKGVVTYTTRPRREGETDGVEYHFISEKVLAQYRRAGKAVELRRYDTVRGPWYYATVDDGSVDLDTGDYLMIATLDSFRSLSDYFGRENVEPVFLAVEDGILLHRALDREDRQTSPDYEELCRRFLADSDDFRPERLRESGVSRVFRNDSLERCLAEIRAMILSKKSERAVP